MDCRTLESTLGRSLRLQQRLFVGLSNPRMRFLEMEQTRGDSGGQGRQFPRLSLRGCAI